MGLLNFFIKRFPEISAAAQRHFQLTGISVIVSVIVGVNYRYTNYKI